MQPEIFLSSKTPEKSSFGSSLALKVFPISYNFKLLLPLSKFVLTIFNKFGINSCLKDVASSLWGLITSTLVLSSNDVI